MENAILPQMSSQLYTYGCSEAFSDITLQMEPETRTTYDDLVFFCMDSNLYTNQANLGGVFCSESEFYCPSDAPSLLTVKSLGYPLLGWDHGFQAPTYNGKRLLVQQSENELHVTKTRKRSIENTETAGQRANDNKLIGKSTAKMAESFQDQVNQKHVKEPVKHIRGGRVPVRRNQKLSDKITALQKLVSPYGKTDTASVLLEASISIKALQDQIQKLCNTVRSSESDRECSSQVGLYGKGLCLVPVLLSQKLAEHNFFNQSLSCFTP